MDQGPIAAADLTPDFEYCFSELCRLCLSSSSAGDVKMKQLFDEESLSDESNEFMLKINYVLGDNILEKVDVNLSNLVCQTCKQKVEEYYVFKKECLRKMEMTQVKIELDKMQLISEEKLEDENFCETERQDDNQEGESCNESDHQDEQIDISGEEKFEDNLEEKTVKLKKAKTTSKDQKFRKTYKGKNSQCQICGKIVAGLSIHMLIHDGIRKHHCSFCKKSFTQSGQLKRHVNSHLNIRNYKCTEPGCDRTFVDPSSVTKHLVVHLDKNDRKFQCSLCGSTFNRLGALKYHEKTHRQERSHTCNICNKSFLAKYDLTKHYRTHTGEKPYGCPHCDKRFSISKNAKVHLRVHTKEKPFNCKFCGLSFAYRSSLKNHLIKIHNHVADVSNLPLLQVINIALNSDENVAAVESSRGIQE